VTQEPRHLQERISHQELLLRLNSEDVCNVLVMFVRFVASAHIFKREDHFLPFILGTMDNCIGVDDFRRRYVEVMGEESDHIQVVAVSEAFQVRLMRVCCHHCGDLTLEQHRPVRGCTHQRAISCSSHCIVCLGAPKRILLCVSELRATPISA
jgi:Peptidase C65 Otubain